MINVAKNMGVVIVCEGAETLEQIEILRDCGVVFVQGYYFYRSVSPDQFEKAIIKNRTRQGDNSCLLYTSPDGCPALCDEFAKKDGRIKVLHKENE